MPDSLDLVRSLNFCCIDLETTGGNHNSDKIFEIGLAKIRNLEITETLEFQINPEIEIPIYVQRLTNIKQKQLAGKPLVEDVIQKILDFIGDDILVAHNAQFDVPFFNSVLKRLDLPTLENRSICTHLMTKHLLPEIQKSNLTYLADLFKIEFKNAHRALSDTVLTAQILIKFLEIFAVRNIKKINSIYYPKNKFELDRIHLNFDEKDAINEKLKLISNTDLHFCLSFKGEQGNLISVIPYSNSLYSLKELKSLIPKSYNKMTILIQGSLVQSLIQFKDYYLNIEKEQREYVLKFLYQKIEYIKDLESSYTKFNHFIIPHIIKDQYFVLNSKNLTMRSPKIFKSPGQLKKSFGMIMKQKQNRSRKNNDLRKVEDLILNVIMKYPEKSIRYSKKLAQNDFKQFSKSINEFLIENTNEIYPTFHL